MEIINIKNLSKCYGRKAVLNSINLSVTQGSIFGLLGPNGAGKTTLISILTTLLMPSSGDADVCGFSLLKNAGEIRRRIGVVFQESVIDEDLSLADNLRFHAMLYKIPKDLREKKIDSLITLSDLQEFKYKQVKIFSGGMKRKAELIRGLLNSPEVLLLDEPTTGLDPRVRKKLWDYILEINKKYGTTVFISTNYLEEAEYLCSHLGILDHGKLVAIGTKKSLLAKLGISKKAKNWLESVFLNSTEESR